MFNNEFRERYSNGNCLYLNCMNQREHSSLSCYQHDEYEISEYIRHHANNTLGILKDYEKFFISIGEKAVNGFGESELEEPLYKWNNPYFHYLEGYIPIEEVEYFEYGPFRISLINQYATFKWKDYIMYIDQESKKIFLNENSKLVKCKQDLLIEPLEELTKEIVNKNYRKSSMKHHPDRGGDRNKFESISKSRDYLINHLEGNNKSMGWIIPSYHYQIKSVPDPDLLILKELFNLIRDMRFYEKIL